MERELDKYYNKGVAAIDGGNWILALQFFRKCRELDNAFVPAYLEMADIFYYNGQYEEALKEIKAALLLEPDNMEARFALGNVYISQGRHKEALMVLTRLEQDSPGFAPEMLYNIGVCYRTLGQQDKALEYFQDAIDDDPSYFECLEMIAKIHIEAGRLDDAGKALKELIEVDPGHINAHHMLGVVHSKEQKWKAAIEEWETVLSLAPNTDDAMREIGWALGMSGEYEKAVSALRKAIEMNPHNLQARIDLGAVFMNNLHFEDAITEWEQARREDPGNPIIKKYLSDAQAQKKSGEGQGKE